MKDVKILILPDPGLFEGDIVLDPDEREGMKNGNAYASIKGGRWPNAVVPYVITGSIGMRFICPIIQNIKLHNHTFLVAFLSQGQLVCDLLV